MEGLQEFKVLFWWFMRYEVFLRPKKNIIQCQINSSLQVKLLNIAQEIVDNNDDHDSKPMLQAVQCSVEGIILTQRLPWRHNQYSPQCMFSCMHFRAAALKVFVGRFQGTLKQVFPHPWAHRSTRALCHHLHCSKRVCSQESWVSVALQSAICLLCYSILTFPLFLKLHLSRDTVKLKE